jgi:hypothetical protein
MLAAQTASMSSGRFLLKFVQHYFASKLHGLALLNFFCSLMAWGSAVVGGRLFGLLSEAERKVLKDNLLTFVLFRVVFMAAMLDVDMKEFMIWTTV